MKRRACSERYRQGELTELIIIKQKFDMRTTVNKKHATFTEKFFYGNEAAKIFFLIWAAIIVGLAIYSIVVHGVPTPREF